MKAVRIGIPAALLVSALFVLNVGAQPTPHANQECLDCHGAPGMTGTDAAGKEISISVLPDSFSVSIHGMLACVDCHTDLATAELPHGDTTAEVSCGSCHADIVDKVANSDHGKAKNLSGARACIVCHGDIHVAKSSSDSTSIIYKANLANVCAQCHDGNGKANVRIKDAVHTYARTVHGRALLEKGNLQAASCADCHSAHDINKPTNPNSRLNRANIPNTCGQCHTEISEIYQTSVHGQAIARGEMESAVCTDCHGEHTIFKHTDPASSVFATTVSSQTCASCHAATRITRRFGLPENVTSYRESYHGLAVKAGATTAANCASCHGVHDILPSSDPKSTINPANLARTCGKCHPGVSTGSLAGFKVHGAPEEQALIIKIAAIFYRWVIPFTIGFMAIHHLLDWLRKVRRHMARERERRAPQRWTPADRREHIVLLVSFIALAYSGFAIKFPGHWWGAPFNFDGGETFRRWFHRVFAIAFTILSFAHVFRLMFTKRGRELFVSMMFKLSDMKMLTDYMSGRRQNLPEDHHPRGMSYIAKAEYWALVWGTAVMTVTGALLAFNDWTLANMPAWMPSFATLVHYYEAVLATLAIVVWHFYPVLMDPAIYPVNLAMWSGKAGEEVSEGFEEESSAGHGSSGHRTS